MPNSLQTIYNVSIHNTGPPLFNTKLNLILFINLNLESRLIPNDIPNLTKLLAHTCIHIKIFHLRNILRKNGYFVTCQRDWPNLMTYLVVATFSSCTDTSTRTVNGGNCPTHCIRVPVQRLHPSFIDLLFSKLSFIVL